MRQLQVKTQAELPSVDEVRMFETNAGIVLPDEFKQFLLKYNPKQTVESKIVSNAREYVVYQWLPLSNTEELSLNKTYDWTRELLEGRYIAFALDAGDWLFVLSIDKADYGRVYFFRPDQELEKGLIPLANTFNGFLNSLA